jgi:prevent-host-death family protein
MLMREITATQFKDRCLRLLDEVAETGEPLVITKRGRPVARLVPPMRAEDLRGSAKVHLSDEELVGASMGAWEIDRG